MTEASVERLTPEQLLEHAGWVRKLARQLVSGTGSDDLEQDAWLAALRHPPAASPGLSAWFGTLMRRAAARRARRDRDRVAREAQAARSGRAPAAADLVAQAETQRLLVGLVLELPDPYRSTLLLRYFGGLTLAEVARERGVPAATVRVHHQRALAELRDLLGARGGRDHADWRASLALLAGSVTGAKAGAATAAAVGVLIMSGKAKLAAAAVILVIVAAIGIWAPWEPRGNEGVANAIAEAQRDGRPTGAAAPAQPGVDPARAGERIATERFDAGHAILGRVVDSAGAPVAGARVVAYPTALEDLITGEAKDRPGSWPRVKATEPDGTFAIADVATSPNLEIVAIHPGWKPGRVEGVVVDQPVVIALEPGVVLRGRVLDFGDAPIAGAQVRVSETSGLVQSDREAVANSDGRYEIRGLDPSSQFYIEAGAPGFATVWLAYLSSSEAAGAQIQDFYLGRGSDLAATAVDAETGVPIANARIRAWALTLADNFQGPGGNSVANPKQVRVLADLRSGEDGKATVRNLPALGVHRLSYRQNPGGWALGGIAASAPGYATAASYLDLREEGTSEAVTLALRPAASLTGRVVDETGSPIAGARLALDEGHVPAAISDDIKERRTDAQGAYLLRGVPSARQGVHEIKIHAWTENETHGRDNVTVEVSGTGVVEAPDLVLARVTSALNRFRILDPAGAPIWGARIEADNSRNLVTDREGRASWPMRVTPDEPPWPVTIRARGYAKAEVVPEPGSPVETVVRLQAAQRISGRVIHRPDGSPGAQVTIAAFRSDVPIARLMPGAEPAEYDRDSAPVRWAGTDTTGAFEFDDLPAGRFHLRAQSTRSDDATVQTVADVETGRADVIIEMPGPPTGPSLLIHVRDRGTKRPILQASVDVTSEWRGHSANATGPGRFLAKELVPGSWLVTVRAPGYALADPVAITVSPGFSPGPLTFELDRGITAKGRATAKGVARFTDPKGWIFGPGGPEIEVGADGAYVARSLTAGASYEVSVVHVPRKGAPHERFVAMLRVPADAPAVVERELELVPSGGLYVMIHAPRLFDPGWGVPKSDEQWRLAKESRLTVRAVKGEWTSTWSPITGNNRSYQLPRGTYVVRLEIPGQPPQERTVEVGEELVDIDFAVP